MQVAKLLKSLIASRGGTIGKFTVANLLLNGSRMVSGLLIARLLTPTALGLFNSIGIYAGYLPLLNLGVMNGLNRDLPFYLGAGKDEKAFKIASVAYYWSFILAVFSFLLFNGVSIYQYSIGDWKMALAWNCYSLASVSMFLGAQYLVVLYRTSRDFDKLSKINIIKSLVVIFSVLFVYQFEFLGLGYRLIAINLIELFLLYKRRPIRVKPKWNKKLFKEIIKTGLPIYMVGQTFALWPVLQNTLIYKFGGPTQFGLFTIYILANGSIGILNRSVSQVLYPRLSFEYGKSKDLNRLISICKKPIAITLLISLPAFAIFYLILPSFVGSFLPKYVDGMEAALWVIPIALLQTIGVFNNIFVVINKLRLYFYSLLIGMAVYLVAVWLFHSIEGFNLTIFPKAMLIGLIALYITNYYQILSLVKKDK